MHSASYQIISKEPGQDRRQGRRQLAVLRAALIDIEGLTHFCRIVNVSEGGLELRLYRPAPVGTGVHIRFASEHCMTGKVVWSRGNSAGVSLDYELDTAQFTRGSPLDPRHRRRMPRATVEASGTLAVGSIGYHANLLDISPAGARVKTVRPLKALGPASLRLPNLGTIPARICWLEETDAGLNFNEPLEMRALECWLESGRSPQS
jgi:hypothetical protein